MHRIGRTGRAGRDGTAISFCCIDEIKQLEQVEKLIGKRLPVKQSEWPMLITTPTDPKEKEAARQLAKAARLAKLGRTAEMPKKLTASGNAVPQRKANKAVKAPVPAKAEKAPAKPVKVAKPAPKAPVKAAKSVQAPAKAAKPTVEYKPRFGPGSAAAPDTSRPVLPKGGKAIIIGKGGKVQNPAKPAPKAAMGKPVQRVNRARGRNGER